MPGTSCRPVIPYVNKAALYSSELVLSLIHPPNPGVISGQAGTVLGHMDTPKIV